MRNGLNKLFFCISTAIFTLSTPTLATTDPRLLITTTTNTLAVIASIVARTELCSTAYPAMSAELSAAYSQWLSRNAKLYASANKNQDIERAVASAKGAYARNNIQISESDCRVLINRLAYVSPSTTSIAPVTNTPVAPNPSKY